MIVKWSRALSDESRTVGLVAKDENALPVVEKNFVMKSRNSTWLSEDSNGMLAWPNAEGAACK